MAQALLFLALHLGGAALCLALGPRDRPWLCAALGFPVGLAVFVLLALALLCTGLPYRPEVVAALGAGMVVAALIRRRPDRRAARVLGVWTAGFAAISAALSSVNLSLLSFDSHAMVMLGRIIGADGRFADLVVGELSSWGVFLPVAQSASAFLPEPYLYSLSPQLGASFIGLFAIVLGHGVRAVGVTPLPKRWIALVTASLVTIFFFQHHFWLIHNNLASAVYLFGFVALFWLAETERDPSLLPVAFLCAIAAGLQRVEAPLFALLFVVLATSSSQLPRRAVGFGLAAFVAVITGWYLMLARHAPVEGQFLTVTRCYLIAGVMVAGGAAWSVAAIRRRAPELALLSCAAALGVAFALQPEHMAVSVRAWLINLLLSGYWGLTWPLLVALLVASTRLPRPPHGAIFVFGLAASVLLTLLLAYGRTPYRAYHVGDSANRMMLHLLPMLCFYLGLKAIPSVAGASAAPPAGSSPPAAG